MRSGVGEMRNRTSLHSIERGCAEAVARSLIVMPRKQFQSSLRVKPELQRLLDEARAKEVSEDELKEQRISFAFGNAPVDAGLITKESVRRASQNIRLS